VLGYQLGFISLTVFEEILNKEGILRNRSSSFDDKKNSLTGFQELRGFGFVFTC